MKTDFYRFSSIQIISLIIVTLIGVLFAVSFHQPLLIGFIPGFLLLVLLVKSKDVPFKKIVKISLNGIRKTKTVIFILFLVSFVLPAWYESGTIGQLVSISLYFITPEHFFLVTFIIAMFFSMTLGTSVGTLSAVGIPIMGTAVELNLSPDIVAGALISGAFVGDRTSPFSSAFQLLSHTVEVPTKKQWKAMFPTTVSAILFGIIVYGLLDYVKDEKVTNLSTFSWHQVSIVTLLPPLILIAVVVFRKGIIYAFIGSITGAVIVALLKGISLQQLSYSFLFGVEGVGGGLANMYLLLLFLALAGAYNGLLEEFKIIQPFIDEWFKKSQTILTDTFKTIGATFGISLIAANQTLPIILTGRTLLPHWSKNQTKEELARVLGDSTMLFPGMIPWSVLAIMCSTIVGIPLLDFFPYAVFLWVLPIMTVIVSLNRHIKQSKRVKEKMVSVS
ncbi:Na+/H+ antiporter NhaC family protein [Fredinandcohnia humi]